MQDKPSTATNNIKAIREITLILFCFLPINLNAAETIVEISLPNQITASARYAHGSPSKPAVLLLHGFLATRDNATLSRIATAIADDGYSILVPTLSLNVDNRQQSLACEAVHTHTMKNDIDEIDRWVNWLQRKGHKEIILFGHSYGSLHALVYLREHTNSAVSHAIATSLVDIEHAIGTEKTDLQVSKANALKSKIRNQLETYKISYCKKFVATIESFISYAEWDKNNIMALLKEIKQPYHIVLGSLDERMDKDWPSLLKAQGVSVSIINGANHFFSDEFEFELNDKVLEILQKIDQ